VKQLFILPSREGPKVIHQVPENSIGQASDENVASQQSPFFSFPAISSFIIPRQSLCGNLISLSPPTPNPHSPPCLILGYPVCLTSPSYSRNEFIFNFALVLSHAESPDVNAYQSVVTKLAHLMRSLEEQSHFLSRDTSPPGTGKLYSLCEMLMEDLNNYCECMIPIDELNTLNIKLFPTYPPPPPVKAWHVPIFTVRPETLMDENWDLTMQRVVPYINGVSSVKQIALLADADYRLTRSCMKHLLYYGCLLLLDIFSFSAIYAPTAEFSTTIAGDEDMQRECARYVNTKFAPMAQETVAQSSERNANILLDQGILDDDDDIWPLTANGKKVDGVGIVQLVAALRHGLSVREWYTENSNALANIDLRRFITFGVIKGFVFRVHKYPFLTGDGVANGAAKPQPSGRKTTGRVITTNGPRRRTTIARSMSSELHIVEDDDVGSTRRLRHVDSSDEDSNGDGISNNRLRKYLDGMHCFDEICTALEISEKELMDRIKRYPGEVLVIHR
jgi:nitrogen permease regulator 2-like protein